jgi:hypothetical protein
VGRQPRLSDFEVAEVPCKRNSTIFITQLCSFEFKTWRLIKLDPEPSINVDYRSRHVGIFNQKLRTVRKFVRLSKPSHWNIFVKVLNLALGKCRRHGGKERSRGDCVHANTKPGEVSCHG